MKKACKFCSFLVHYGGNEYGCSKEDDCPINGLEVEHYPPHLLMRDIREPFSRVKIPKF